MAACIDVKYPDGELPAWHEGSGNYLDPATGGVPAHLGPGTRRHRRGRWRAAARGQVRGQVRRPGRARRITRRQPVNRLPHLIRLDEHLGDRHRAESGTQNDDAECLVQALRYEPCSPRCANWLRDGIQLDTPWPGRGPDTARARPIAANTWATPGRWCQVSIKMSWLEPIGPPRRPQGMAAGHPRHPRRWTRPATPGNRSYPATPTPCHPHSGCCTSSPTGNAGHAALTEARRRANAPPNLSATAASGEAGGGHTEGSQAGSRRTERGTR